MPFICLWVIILESESNQGPTQENSLNKGIDTLPYKNYSTFVEGFLFRPEIIQIGRKWKIKKL